MEKSIGSQAVSLALFFVGGYVLGPLYDSMRLIRIRRGIAAAVFTDIVFCAAVGLGLFCLAMRDSSGAFGTWECTCFLIGFVVYCISISPTVTSLMLTAEKLADRIATHIKNIFISYCKTLKKHFQKSGQ